MPLKEATALEYVEGYVFVGNCSSLVILYGLAAQSVVDDVHIYLWYSRVAEPVRKVTVSKEKVLRKG
jgi:hypothetical protein